MPAADLAAAHARADDDPSRPGNDGGDGSESLTNPPGQDPTGGIISVASYFDQGTGTLDGAVSEYSSRGSAADPSTWPDLLAPGEDIESACRPYLPICSTGLAPNNGPGLLDVGTFNAISGTSMAVGTRSTSFDTGTGLVDVVAAVAAL